MFFLQIFLLAKYKKNNDFVLMCSALELIEKYKDTNLVVDQEICKELLDIVFDNSPHSLDVKNFFDIRTRYSHSNPDFSGFCNTDEEYAEQYWIDQHVGIPLGLIFESEKNLALWINSEKFNPGHFTCACIYLSDTTTVFFRKKNELLVQDRGLKSYSIILKEEIIMAIKNNFSLIKSKHETITVNKDFNMPNAKHEVFNLAVTEEIRSTVDQAITQTSLFPNDAGQCQVNLSKELADVDSSGFVAPLVFLQTSHANAGSQTPVASTEKKQPYVLRERPKPVFRANTGDSL